MERMFLLIVIALVSFVSACDDYEVSDSTDSAIEDSTPAPPLAPLPNVFFNTEDKIEVWQEDVAREIDKTAELDDPNEIVQLIAAFDINQDALKSMAGDTRYWMGPVANEPHEYDEIDDPHDVSLTITDAERLEDADSEYEAGKIYAHLGDTAGVIRCAEALVDEGEWKAVALLGIYLDDFALLDQATDKMMAADLRSKTCDVINVAISSGQTKAAKHVADRHGFDVVDGNSSYTIIDRVLGDNDYELLPDLVEWQMTSDDPERSVELIVILAEHDKMAARGYARQYLEQDKANTFGSVGCYDGCYAYGVTGSIGFYNLVKGNAELRELYFQRTRESVERFIYYGRYSEVDLRTTELIEGYDFTEQMYYMTSGMQSFAGGFTEYSSILWSALYAVRLNGDANLIAAWSGILDDFGKYSVFGREFGRAMLGQKFSYDTEGLGSTEQFILTSLAGKEMDTFNARDSDWQEHWFEQILSGAEISSTDAVRLWDAVFVVEMDVDDGVRYDPAEFDEKAKVAARLYEDIDLRNEAAAIYLVLVRSGWRGELPNAYTGLNGVNRFRRHTFGPADWSLVYEAARIGHVDYAKRIIITAWRKKLRRSFVAMNSAVGHLVIDLNEPFQSADFNARQMQNAVDGVFYVDETKFTPRTSEAANAIFAGIADKLRADLPEAYRNFILDQAEAGNTGLYEAEVARLVDADQGEALDRLISAREARVSN